MSCVVPVKSVQDAVIEADVVSAQSLEGCSVDSDVESNSSIGDGGHNIWNPLLDVMVEYRTGPVLLRFQQDEEAGRVGTHESGNMTCVATMVVSTEYLKLGDAPRELGTKWLLLSDFEFQFGSFGQSMSLGPSVPQLNCERRRPPCPSGTVRPRRSVGHCIETYGPALKRTALALKRAALALKRAALH